MWLNDYKWALVAEYLDEENNTKHCGTVMFYENLINFYIPKPHTRNVFLDNFSALDFVEIVRQYDTYEWKSKYNNVLPKQINDLMYILGRDTFIETVLDKLSILRDYELTEQDLKLLKRNQETIDHYIESKNKSIIVKEIQGYQAGVVFAEKYVSELGNKLSELHPELDFIAMINPSHSVSYRTVKKDVDLSVIASMFCGGGHRQASGSPIDEDMKNRIINLVFS